LRTCCEVRETSSHVFALRQDLLLILNSWADTSFGRFRNDDYENWEPLDAVLFAGSETRNLIQTGTNTRCRGTDNGNHVDMIKKEKWGYQ